ncbi:MAG: hypothetical protein AAF636_23980 [Pseudomonadota bacterium]
MNDFHIGRHRSVPLHAPGMQADVAQNSDLQRDVALQDTAQNNTLQQDAALAPDMQLHAPETQPATDQKPNSTLLPIEAYTISVDHPPLAS